VASYYSAKTHGARDSNKLSFNLPIFGGKNAKKKANPAKATQEVRVFTDSSFIVRFIRAAGLKITRHHCSAHMPALEKIPGRTGIIPGMSGKNSPGVREIVPAF
jgi:hypothetical protein